MHVNDLMDEGVGNHSPGSMNDSRRSVLSTTSGDFQSHALPGANSSGSSASSNNNQSNSKTGRKGDPRMHRAVAARVANPKISLFEALRIGGFEYTQDTDSNAMDSEQITLGQRKNQLSRRVRLARQQQKEGRLMPDKTVSARSTTSTASPSPGGRPVTSRGKRSITADDAEGNKRPFLLQDGDGGLSEDPTLTKMNDDIVTNELAEQSRLVAKNHPGYHPILFRQHVAPTVTATGDTGPPNGMLNGFFVNQTFEQGPGNAPFPPPNRPFAHGATLGAPNSSLFGTAPALSGGNAAGTAAGATSYNQMFASGNVGGAVGTHRQNEGAVPQQGAVGGFVEAPAHVSLANSSSQNTSRDSPPHYQEQQPAPAGVTVASLTQSAASVGMSLEQLAVALQSNNNLAQLLSSGGTPPTQAQHSLAISLYQSENQALYQRSMLLAGFPAEIAQDERSPQYLQMALNAWQAEGQRLNALINQTEELMDPPLEANAPAPGPGGGSAGSGGGGGRTRSVGSHGDHSHDHHHHGHDSSQPSGGGGSCAFEGGRHIHRLEGKCGHKAILHQPTDGTAHIDFVVGNRVECYHGVEPLSNATANKNSANIKIWPSNYRCKDLSCENKCKDAGLECQSKAHKNAHADCCNWVAGDPKILDLEDIDLEGSEWNSDFSNGETVLGLFHLGSDTKANPIEAGVKE